MIDSTEPAVVEDRARVARRSGRPQLGQPRGRGRAGHPPRPLPLARPASTAPRSSAPASTRRARPAPRTGSCVRREAIHDLAVDRYGLAPEDLFFDPLALPLSTGHGGEPPRRHRDDRGDPQDQGRAPGRAHGPRALERLVRPLARRPARSSTRSSSTSASQAGLDAAIVHAAQDPAPPQDRRARPGDLPRPHLRPPPRGLRPALGELIEALRGESATSATRQGGPLAAGRSTQRLERRIVDGDRNGLEADLAEALAAGHAALAIVNDVLLAGMRTVGELFGVRRDAAPLRAPVGRDDEGRRRLPRAPHGAQPSRAAGAGSCSRR